MLFPSEADLPLPPAPGWVQPVMWALCILPILLPAGPIRLRAGGPILALLFYVLVWTREQTLEAYVTGNICLTLIYRWLDLLVIHTPEKDFWRPSKGKQQNGNEHVTEASTKPNGAWGKLKWFPDLFLSVRGIGWNIRAKNLPPSVSIETPKAPWLFSTALKAFIAYLGVNATEMITAKIYTDGTFFNQPLMYQVAFAWNKAFHSYYGIEFHYCLASIIAVTLGYGGPSDWPPAFGTFRHDAYTVRKMWGTCWHQFMRRACSEAGRIVKEICGFRTGSFMSKYSQVWVAFAVSTLSHHAGAIVGTFEDGGYWQMAYFMVQPVGFMVEDFVIFLGGKLGIRESAWTKSLGFLWVSIWFSWTIRFMVSYQPASWSTQPSLPNLIVYTSGFVGASKIGK